MLRPKRHIAAVAVFFLTTVLTGCEPMVTIQGNLADDDGRPLPGVVDPEGNALPGVAVTVRGTTEQAISDGLGQYKVQAAPGVIQLDFIKTGYTPARLQFEVNEPRPVPAAPALLWPLPPAKGAFLYENYRYTGMTRIEPRRYLVRGEEGAAPETVFGVKLLAECSTLDTNPLLIFYKLPFYDARCYLLEPMKAAEPAAPGAAAPPDSAYQHEIWAPTAQVPVAATPLDETARLLFELRPDRPFIPGTYAIHWGALDGHRDIEPNIYLFAVRDPNAPAVEVEPAPEDAGSAETSAN